MFVKMRTLAMSVAASAFLLGVPAAHAANTVSNPGFETGDFTSWTLAGNTGFSGVTGFAAHSGAFGALFDNSGSVGGIFQDLTVDANSTYNVDFWLQNFAVQEQLNSFEVLFDGVSLTSLTNSGNFGYTLFHFAAATDGGTTARLEFRFRHDTAAWTLDDVCVDNARNGACANAQEVPEPATLALLSAGLLGLALRRRVKA